jgi:2-keto-3-deoxy-L-rhamnonate aldolase RhmA
MLPRVDTVEQAARAVSQAYFPPLGHRGSGLGMSPFLLDGLDAGDTALLTMTGYVNANTMLFPQTESLTAVVNLRQILGPDGVTGTIVGTNDLALDIGDIAPGALRSQVNSGPFIEGKLREIARVCKEVGKVAGIGGFPPRGCAKWAGEGYQLFTLGYIVDGNVAKLEAVVKEARELVG